MKCSVIYIIKSVILKKIGLKIKGLWFSFLYKGSEEKLKFEREEVACWVEKYYFWSLTYFYQLEGVHFFFFAFIFYFCMYNFIFCFSLLCRSVLCGGAPAIFMFSYGICFFARSNMRGFMQLSFFLGYNACICYAFFLMLGTVSFRASFMFVSHIYHAVKSEWTISF